jgi:ABC-type multidrug transport system fused ATPase/permease subunit
MSLNLSAVFFIFIRAYVLLIAGNNQSKLVHDKMIKGILYADLSNFFNRVPIGRIVNRLTKDLRELDEVVMDYFIYVLISIVELLGGLFICVYAGTPFALIPMIVVGFLAN